MLPYKDEEKHEKVVTKCNALDEMQALPITQVNFERAPNPTIHRGPALMVQEVLGSPIHAENDFRDEFIISAILSIVMFVIVVALISIVVILIKSKKKNIYSGLGATTDNSYYSSIRNSSNAPTYITVLPDAESIPSYLAILPETENRQSITLRHNGEIHYSNTTDTNVSVVQNIDQQKESSKK